MEGAGVCVPSESEKDVGCGMEWTEEEREREGKRRMGVRRREGESAHVQLRPRPSHPLSPSLLLLAPGRSWAGPWGARARPRRSGCVGVWGLVERKMFFFFSFGEWVCGRGTRKRGLGLCGPSGAETENEKIPLLHAHHRPKKSIPRRTPDHPRIARARASPGGKEGKRIRCEKSLKRISKTKEVEVERPTQPPRLSQQGTRRSPERAPPHKKV